MLLSFVLIVNNNFIPQTSRMSVSDSVLVGSVCRTDFVLTVSHDRENAHGQATFKTQGYNGWVCSQFLVPSEVCICISLSSSWETAGCSHKQAVQFMSRVTVMYSITIMYICSFQVLIASIMCSYNREDWTELSKMAEVMVSWMCFHIFFYKFSLKTRAAVRDFLKEIDSKWKMRI